MSRYVTFGITSRRPSVDTYVMRSCSSRWRPWIPTPPRPVCPPTFITSTVVDGVFFSSSAYFVRTTNLSPTNLAGQWHCSQVSRAGLRLWTGVGIGRE